MLQLYFLSVASNLIAGIILASDWLVSRFAGLRPLVEFLSHRRARLTAGLGALFVGLVTLLFPSRSPIILGDLAPSLAGVAMGVALLFEVLRQESLFPAEKEVPVGRGQIAYRTTLGMIGLATAVVHFFLPERIIL